MLIAAFFPFVLSNFIFKLHNVFILFMRNKKELFFGLCVS